MNAFNIFHNEKKDYLEDLLKLLRIPSVSRDRNNIKKTADWLTNRLKQTADYIEQIETEGNPVIIAHWQPQSTSRLNKKTPTLLIYGHYDVQSPEPLDAWISPPFEPEIRGERIYARGAGDNKGQFFANITAIECVHKSKSLGLNIKVLLDGEEEIGSPNLEKVLMTKADFFNDIDLIIVSDGPADPSWSPTIVFGVRGIVTVQIDLQSAKNDAHSGNFGGIQPNPVLDIISIITTMINEEGKCLIRGFYDDVFTPDSTSLRAVNELNRTTVMYKEYLDISYFGGEQDQPLSHRVMFRPTFNVCGFQSGHVRENTKTIIPKEAVIELDLRLVPYQEPQKVEKLFLQHLAKLKKRSDRWTSLIDRCNVAFGANFHPIFTPLNLKWTDILQSSLQKGFGKKPVRVPLLGGSLPLFALHKITHKPLYIIPYAQPDQSNHAPNENIMIDWWEMGIKSTIYLLENLAKLNN
jgi:acetylornithine deacetylase/succinyl-diaminopimelate desuccinylase-like protein